ADLHPNRLQRADRRRGSRLYHRAGRAPGRLARSGDTKMQRIGNARFLGVLVFLAAALVAGCGEGQAPSGASVEEVRLTREDGRQVVTGTLANPSDRPLAGVAVEVALYDQPVEPGVTPIETIRVE